MNGSGIGVLPWKELVSVAGLGLGLVVFGACGKQQSQSWDDSGTPSSSSSSGGASSSGTMIQNPNGEGGPLFGFDATAPMPDASGSSSGVGPPVISTAIGGAPASDCAGCTFPGPTAMPCASSAPAIKIVYPPDTVLVPPNMNVMSVQWTPNGSYQRFSVDFSNPPNTDWHIVTKCANQTIDAQSGSPSAGCEVVIDPLSWSKLAGANRGQGPVTITVRGTTDGTCATASTNQIHWTIAEEDLLGTYYYWKSTISSNGIGGQIWKKTFGDLNMMEQDVTSQSINATCSGCHSLSRDGTRMVVYSDDDDSDDEYSDIAGSYLDMTTNPATEYPGGVTSGGHGGGGQPAGFSTIDPNVTALTSTTSQGYYITSNGYPCAGTGACGSATTGYTTAVPLNGFSVWNGTNGSFINGVTIGAAGTRPTMPDWGPDGTSVVYVVPKGEFTWRTDDAHIYGGSLYTVPYTGAGTFGAATQVLASNGENNYYPSYSPDVNPTSFIIFNRVDNMNQGTNCSGGFCPDDSFSNPAARLMLLGTAAGATPVDLEKANGSPIVSKTPLSNSYPRWAPFVQTYKGNKLLWFTFSSTRDYGVRVLNHKQGMYQCYPSDAAETPGGAHRQPFAPQCQEPQLWMAPLYFSEAMNNKDPSGVAFWIPYQDIATHNHTAQWTQQHVPPPPPPVDASTPCMCQAAMYGPCGVANGGCDCCTGNGYCTGSNTCFAPPH
jgi:hypothetical protein